MGGPSFCAWVSSVLSEFGVECVECVEILSQRVLSGGQQCNDFLAREVVRLCQRNAEGRGAVDAGELVAHPRRHGFPSGIKKSVCRSFGAIALAVHRRLGDVLLDSTCGL